MYVVDQRTANILNAISPSIPGEDLQIYSFIQDPWRQKTASYHSRLDWILLGLSGAAKLIESFVLWRYGALMLALVTILSWLFFFSAALTLQLYDLRRHAPISKIDIVTGSLPTCSTVGGTRKILLGVTKSTRQHVLWKTIWGLGGIVGVIAVIATYLALAHPTSTNVFFIWTGFQLLWLALRSTLFYLLSDREKQDHVGLEYKPWPKVGPQERARVCRLVFALSKYQQHLHPRGLLSYTEDMESVESLHNVRSEYPLSSNEEIVPISVHGVIGDTLLASTSWVFGSKRGGHDFYDTCIIILNTPDGTIAIPAARALPSKPPQETLDFELGVQTTHLPRGGLLPLGSRGNFLNIGIDVQWCYWIPCSEGRWLFFMTEQTKVKGTRNASVLSDQQMMDKLERGKIFISLKHVGEVKEIVENSTLVCGFLLELLK